MNSSIDYPHQHQTKQQFDSNEQVTAQHQDVAFFERSFLHFIVDCNNSLVVFKQKQCIPELHIYRKVTLFECLANDEIYFCFGVAPDSVEGTSFFMVRASFGTIKNNTKIAPDLVVTHHHEKGDILWPSYEPSKVINFNLFRKPGLDKAFLFFIENFLHGRF